MVSLTFLPEVCEDTSFIDQGCLVKMARYWPSSFFVFIDLDSVMILKDTQKDFADIQSS